MTEDEAKKILDFLTKRIQRSLSMHLNNCAMVKITKNYLDDIIVTFKYTEKSISGWRFLWAHDKYSPRVVKLNGKLTAKNIVRCLLEKAKDYDINIDMNDLAYGCVIVLSKDESLEELKIKTDLEDF